MIVPWRQDAFNGTMKTNIRFDVNNTGCSLFFFQGFTKFLCHDAFQNQPGNAAFVLHDDSQVLLEGFIAGFPFFRIIHPVRVNETALLMDPGQFGLDLIDLRDEIIRGPFALNAVKNQGHFHQAVSDVLHVLPVGIVAGEAFGQAYEAAQNSCHQATEAIIHGVGFGELLTNVVRRSGKYISYHLANEYGIINLVFSHTI